MSLLSRIIFLIISMVICCSTRALATCSTSMPYTFVSTSPLSYTTTNANNNFLLSCANTVDHTQIGTGGVYASQIVPTTSSQATFGGSQPYTFPTNLTVNGNGTFTGNITAVNITNSGNTMTTGNTITAGNSGTTGYVQGHYISSNYSTNQGLYYGGGSNTSQLDYNITNTNQWTFSSPLTVTGSVTGTSATYSGNVTVGQLSSTGSVLGTGFSGTTASFTSTGSFGGTLTTHGINAAGAISSASYISGQNLDTASSTNQGTVNFGSSNAAEIDYNTANANIFSMSAPLSVNGSVTANGLTSSSSLTVATGITAASAGITGQVSAGTLSAPTVAGFVSGVGDQIFPTYFNGNPVTAMTTAHNEAYSNLTANTSGVVSGAFASAFSQPPSCTVSPVSSSAPNVIPFFTTLNGSAYSFTGNASFHYNMNCIGY